MDEYFADNATTVDLLRRACDRDATALNDLVKLVQPWLRGCLRRFLNDHNDGASDLEDVLQETLLTVHVRIGELKDCRPYAFRAWATTIASNHARNHWRRQQRRSDIAAQRTLTDNSSGPDETGTLGDSPEKAARRNEHRRRFAAALGKLTADKRAVVEKRLRGLGHQEIAQALAITPENSRQLLNRAIKELADEIGAEAWTTSSYPMFLGDDDSHEPGRIATGGSDN